MNSLFLTTLFYLLGNFAFSFPKTYVQLPEAYSKSVLSISPKSERQVISQATAISHNRLLTKWSEIEPYTEDTDLQIDIYDSKRNCFTQAQLLGIYPDDDLALIELPHAELQAIDLPEQPEPLTTGQVIIHLNATTPFGKKGIVSTPPRSTRMADRGFLGVGYAAAPQQQSGVKITYVPPNTPAKQAGIKKNDLLLNINGNPITGTSHFAHLLQNKPAKTTIQIELQRAQLGLMTKTVTLAHFPRNQYTEAMWRTSPRIEVMNALSTELSAVRKEFPWVIQTDLNLNAYECGSPVLDTQGNFVGLTIARVSRISTYLVPAQRIQELLEQKPLSIKEASEYLKERRVELAFPRPQPNQ